MKKILIPLLLIMITTIQIKAQDLDKGAFAIKTGSYHTPEVQALMRYGEIPVSYFTGTPQIEIPLYKTNFNDLSLDISLSYHASGIKVDDIATSVGLGWVLNAGGVISRTVNGLADETAQNGFLNKTFTQKELSSDFYTQHMYNTQWATALDCSSDNFSYNFMGHTGKFSFGTDRKIHVTPFSDLKFEFVNNLYFKVKTPEGHVFIFNDKEDTRINGGGSRTATTAWHLSKIILNNNAGEIDFSYVQGGTYEDRFPSFSSFQMDRSSTSMGQNSEYRSFYIDNDQPNKVSYSYFLTGMKYISEIKFPTSGSCGKIVFEYDQQTLRQDFLSGKILRAIKVYNSNIASIPIKHWELNQLFVLSNAGYNASYHYNTDRYRMFLSQITEKSASIINQVYKMEYNATLLPCRKSFGKDLWGYYNGKTGNVNSIYINAADKISFQKMNLSFSTTNVRKGNEAYMQAGSLSKLIYPTGGYTFFEYEGHQLSDGEKAGGLRVKSIKNYDNGGLTSSKHYKYGMNESGVARVSTFNYNKNYKTIRGGATLLIVPCEYSFIIHTIESQPFYPSYLGYECVTEYTGDISGVNGKIEYYYDFTMDDMADSDGGSPNPQLFISNRWQNGSPKETKTYKKGTNGFDIIKKEIHNYNKYTMTSSGSNCVSLKFYYFGAHFGDNINYCNEQEYMSYFIPITSEVKKLTETIITSYSYTGLLKDSVVTATHYYYGGLRRTNNPHSFLSSTTIINSDGRSSEIEHTYLTDILTVSSNTHPVYKAMYERNMVSIPLQTIKKNNGNVAEASVLLFRKDPGEVLVPSVQKKLETITPVNNYQNLKIESVETMDSRLTNHLTYDKFDTKGNLIQYTGLDNIRTTTLWSYNYQYPIAEIRGAAYSDVTGKIAQATLDALALKPVPTATDLAPVNALRTTLPNALITTYTYKPLVGMETMIDPRGVKTTYEYDAFGRLKTVKDHSGSAVNQYEYNYKNN